jgi:hypothetical protein
MKKLTNLIEFDAEFCFHSALPSVIGKLSNLSILDLSDCSIGDSFPTLITNLTNLTSLNLLNCYLKGSIPLSVTNLTKLQTLNLASNQLSGSLTPLNDLSNLTSLNISSNLFTFTGMETIARKFPFTTYSPQNTLLTENYNGGTFSVSAGGVLTHNKYQWYKNGKLTKTISGDSTFTPTATSGATFVVYVTNSVATALTLQSNPYTFSTLLNNEPSATDKIDKGFNVSVYPNPAHSSITVNFIADNTNTILQIINASGQRLMQKQITTFSGNNTAQVDVSKLAAGIYMLLVKTKSGVEMKRFVKE